MKYLFENLSNKKVLILGFGREGQSNYRLLRQEYPKILISIADIKNIEIKGDENTTLYLGEKYLDNICDFDYIIKSPGIPFGKELIEAKRKGIEITSQTKIFFEKCCGQIIGVTGTKGKSTTSTLIYQILKENGLKTFLVGNIENPSLEALASNNGEDVVFVYELSSQQLADLDKSPQISIVLNVGVDHLDWHGSREEYVNAKKNIVRYQTISDFAILNSDDQIARDFAKSTKAKVIYFSKSFLENKFKQRFFLRGEHNLENIAAIVAVARILKIKDEIILGVLSTFKGLEHRLEWVREVGRINFYNDSASTNQTSVKAAVNSFNEPITLIMGGYDRGINYDELAEYLSKIVNLKIILLIGQIGDKIKKSLEKAEYKGKMLNLGKNSMEIIVKTAFENTANRGVVLLSPAAASFDMFKNYKDRGDQFKKAVNSLT
jgi:UDP-N-acetylmuramoylalanine--D-glutamate ligase